MFDFSKEPYSISIYEDDAAGKVAFCDLPEHLLPKLAEAYGEEFMLKLIAVGADEQAFCKALPERDAGEPRYLKTLRTGEFEKRVRALEAAGYGEREVPYFMTAINRSDEAVLGRTGCLYFVCNKGCHFCQYRTYANYPMTAQGIADRMLAMQAEDATNIQWVSPTAHTRTLVQALFLAAKQGLRIPLVHKSEGEDSLADLRLLDGLVDIYLPDVKFVTPSFSPLIGLSAKYPQHAAKCLAEMLRQVGPLKRSTGSLHAAGGLMVRHLVMPTGVDEAKAVLGFIRSLSAEIPVSLMFGYEPTDAAIGHPVIGRHLTRDEIVGSTKAARESGLRHVYLSYGGRDET